LLDTSSERRKTPDSLKKHGRFMTMLVALNALSIVLVMGPSLFLNLGGAAVEVSVIGFPLTLVHHLIGLSAEIQGAVLVFKKFGKVRTWMRIIFTIWSVAVVLGIIVYIRYYVI
jgi:uncharacterized membrane protein YozB (DUF420 family)